MNQSTQSHTPTEPLGELLRLLESPRLDGEGRDRVVSLLYPELRRIAEAHMRRERGNHTLQATALVSEFYLRLCRSPTLGTGGRRNFLAAASRAMRRLLVDHARTRGRNKRGAGVNHIDIDTVAVVAPEAGSDVRDIDELLTELAAEQPRLADVVELRFFGGLSHCEIGDVLGVHERTVKRDWQVARAWLHVRLKERAG